MQFGACDMHIPFIFHYDATCTPLLHDENRKERKYAHDDAIIDFSVHVTIS